jgi:hypothetical protein
VNPHLPAADTDRRFSCRNNIDTQESLYQRKARTISPQKVITTYAVALVLGAGQSTILTFLSARKMPLLYAK